MSFLLNEILSEFNIPNTVYEFNELSSGHINNTYVVAVDGVKVYVLQRLNGKVFKNVKGLINNKTLISKHLSMVIDDNYKPLTFVNSIKENFHFVDEYGEYWCLMNYVKRAQSHSTPASPMVAGEAGRTVGRFLYHSRNFDVKQLEYTFPKFHNLLFRLEQLDIAIERTNSEKHDEASGILLKIEKLRIEMLKIDAEIRDVGMPTRVTHNDTKLSNIMFDENENGLCMIDLDTVMPGKIAHDFGDSIRTLCNTANEDEVDLSKINFNDIYFEAFTKGFFYETKNILEPVELNCLASSVKLMPYIMAVRFITDFLNGNEYFKVSNEKQNLFRASCQINFLEKVTANNGSIEEIIRVLS